MKNFNPYITHSWTQPYTSLNSFFQSKAVQDRVNDLTIEEQLDKIEMVDRWVDSMLTFPDAEAILNKIMEEGKNYD